MPFCTSVGANGFFKFPACSARKAEWIKCCGLTGHNVTSKDRVCYEHFENWCFVNTIHPNRRKFLRPNAKPEKNLPLNHTEVRYYYKKGAIFQTFWKPDCCTKSLFLVD